MRRRGGPSLPPAPSVCRRWSLLHNPRIAASHGGATSGGSATPSSWCSRRTSASRTAATSASRATVEPLGRRRGGGDAGSEGVAGDALPPGSASLAEVRGGLGGGDSLGRWDGRVGSVGLVSDVKGAGKPFKGGRGGVRLRGSPETQWPRPAPCGGAQGLPPSLPQWHSLQYAGGVMLGSPGFRSAVRRSPHPPKGGPRLRGADCSGAPRVRRDLAGAHRPRVRDDGELQGWPRSAVLGVLEAGRRGSQDPATHGHQLRQHVAHDDARGGHRP